MVLLLLLEGCAVPIHDSQWCAEIPGNFGAVCDHFLSSKPEQLTEVQWEARKAQWMASGNAVECTPSSTVGDIKVELEELCSKTRCDYQIEAAVLDGLSRIQALGY